MSLMALTGSCTCLTLILYTITTNSCLLTCVPFPKTETHFWSAIHFVQVASSSVVSTISPLGKCLATTICPDIPALFSCLTISCPVRCICTVVSVPCVTINLCLCQAGTAFSGLMWLCSVQLCSVCTGTPLLATAVYEYLPDSSSCVFCSFVFVSIFVTSFCTVSWRV
jgi:hypothetical protein